MELFEGGVGWRLVLGGCLWWGGRFGKKEVSAPPLKYPYEDARRQTVCENPNRPRNPRQMIPNTNYHSQ
uniref:Secreted protein n=1 Tax=Knipowitschia caucasica TaxID=637954 RepID=A0AAV2L9C0_KNICA